MVSWALIGIVGVPFLFVAWFVPWVLLLHGGILLYFPYEADGQSRYLRATGPWTSEWLSEQEIPNACKAALVASEDTKFYDHNGLDIESLEQSYKQNKRAGKIKRGGSTITQQLVKNAFLSREKTMLRKGREIVGAVLLDATVSKNSQLTWYLNIVEFGPKIYGLQEAAQFYFKKDGKKLSAAECISLAVILPSPNRWNASLTKRRFSSFFRKRYNTIVARADILELMPQGELGMAKRKDPFSEPTGYVRPSKREMEKLDEETAAVVEEVNREMSDVKPSAEENPEASNVAPQGNALEPIESSGGTEQPVILETPLSPEASPVPSVVPTSPQGPGSFQENQGDIPREPHERLQ
jgi:monofunctional biosynthetic peptidoglycan transglycosylase